MYLFIHTTATLHAAPYIQNSKLHLFLYYYYNYIIFFMTESNVLCSPWHEVARKHYTSEMV